jgi:hypothetical protein
MAAHGGVPTGKTRCAVRRAAVSTSVHRGQDAKDAVAHARHWPSATYVAPKRSPVRGLRGARSRPRRPVWRNDERRVVGRRNSVPQMALRTDRCLAVPDGWPRPRVILLATGRSCSHTAVVCKRQTACAHQSSFKAWDAMAAAVPGVSPCGSATLVNRVQCRVFARCRGRTPTARGPGPDGYSVPAACGPECRTPGWSLSPVVGVRATANSCSWPSANPRRVTGEADGLLPGEQAPHLE